MNKIENQIEHIPVLSKEIIDLLPEEPKVILDLTFGRGGHAEMILQAKMGIEKYIAVDIDPTSSLVAEDLSKRFSQIEFINAGFDEFVFRSIMDDLKVDFVMADLGISSFQLDDPDRGFSFFSDAPLDMRMSKSNSKTAEQIINHYNTNKLKEIFRDYGEENLAGFFAKKIVAARENKLFKTSVSLGDFIKTNHPYSYKLHHHPATRIFQALRIEVNDEMEKLSSLLSNIPKILAIKGVCAIISFHSLEDRKVKKTFRKICQKCQCPKDIPYCLCGGESSYVDLTTKPILPSENEIQINNRARSAKLRAVRRDK